MQTLRVSFLWIIVLAAILGGMFAWATVAGATNYPPPPHYGTDVCDTLSYNTAFRWGYTFEQTDIALHSVGCRMDDGGVYVKAHYPVRDAGICNTLAYNLAKITVRKTHNITRGDVRRIVKAVKEHHRSGCIQFEDGTYYRT